MDSVMVSTVLVNILLGCFCLAVLSWVLVGVETFIHDRKREKREESAKRDSNIIEAHGADRQVIR